jgi:Na+/H+ antiporter NhaD/arsenite permease-like protein
LLAPLLVFVASMSIIAFARPGPVAAAAADDDPDRLAPEPGFFLDRPAGALLGALGMVLCGTVSTTEAIHKAVNFDTLILLFGMMVVCAYMMEARLFRYVSWLTLTHVRSARTLLIATVAVSGLLSAVLVNDTICLMVTPLVVACCRDARLKPLPFLLAVCFGANAGSVATPTGNPQNMIIATLSGIPYTRFVLSLGLPALLSMTVVAAVLLLLFRRDLPAGPLPVHAGNDAAASSRPRLDPMLSGLCLVVLFGILVGFVIGYSLAWTSLVGAALLVLLGRRSPRLVLERIDHVLLVFFAGLFVVVYGVGKAGIAELLFARLTPYLGETPLGQATVFAGFTLVLSQLVSNVPFVLLASHFVPHYKDPTLMWLSMAMVSTLAGNLTIVGSVANIIVLDTAEKHLGRGAASAASGSASGFRVSFFQFLGYGAIVTLLTTGLSLALLYLERSFGLI